MHTVQCRVVSTLYACMYECMYVVWMDSMDTYLHGRSRWICSDIKITFNLLLLDSEYPDPRQSVSIPDLDVHHLCPPFEFQQPA